MPLTVRADMIENVLCLQGINAAILETLERLAKQTHTLSHGSL